MKTTLWANRLISDVVEDNALACTVGKKGGGGREGSIFYFCFAESNHVQSSSELENFSSYNF